MNKIRAFRVLIAVDQYIYVCIYVFEEENYEFMVILDQ